MQVSVIIPTYNSARFLTEAIDSVLAQSFKDFEILVIDDGSTDETKAVMQRYGSPVRYIYQANAGVAAARNRGIELSRGKYVAFLDADDAWFADKLETQLDALAKHADCRACYSAFTVADHHMNSIDIRRSNRQGRAIDDLLSLGNLIGTPSTVLCERPLFEAVGGFDPEMSQCADWDMWVRIASHTEFLYIAEPLVKYRQHDGNMSRSASLLESDSLRVLEKGFAMTGLTARQRGRRRAAFARNYMVLAGAYFQAGSYGDFARCAARAMAMDFRQAGYLMAYPVRMTARLLGHKSAETV